MIASLHVSAHVPAHAVSQVEPKYILDLSNVEKPHAETVMNIRMTEEIIQTKTETRFKCVATYLSQQENTKTVELPLVNSLYCEFFLRVLSALFQEAFFSTSMSHFG